MENLKNLIDESLSLIKKHSNTPMNKIPENERKPFFLAYVIAQAAINNQKEFSNMLSEFAGKKYIKNSTKKENK